MSRVARHAVTAICIDGVAISGFTAGQLLVQEEPPADFQLTFETLGGHNLPAQANLEVLVADGRTYRGNGVDSMPNPWAHRYVNGSGTPGWAERSDAHDASTHE